MGGRINTDLVLNAITMACWRSKPKGEVIDVNTFVMIGRACLKRTV
jgi:hypothetical protein